MITIADAIDRDVLRIRHEFLEMPGLALTVAETARRNALSTAHAKALLEALEAEGFLVSGPDGAYRRSTSRYDDLPFAAGTRPRRSRMRRSHVKNSPPRTCFSPHPVSGRSFRDSERLDESADGDGIPFAVHTRHGRICRAFARVADPSSSVAMAT